MTVFLGVEDLVYIARRSAGVDVQVRDAGLLASAAARPMTRVFGSDAYPDLWTKATALLHSLAHNHPLVDGNQRLAWTAAVVFLAVNGSRIEVEFDDAFAFVIAVASSELDDVAAIAERLQSISHTETS